MKCEETRYYFNRCSQVAFFVCVSQGQLVSLALHPHLPFIILVAFNLNYDMNCWTKLVQ